MDIILFILFFLVPIGALSFLKGKRIGKKFYMKKQNQCCKNCYYCNIVLCNNSRELYWDPIEGQKMSYAGECRDIVGTSKCNWKRRKNKEKPIVIKHVVGDTTSYRFLEVDDY